MELPKPRFKVGDRVKAVALLIIEGRHLIDRHPPGREGEIIAIEEDEATGIRSYGVRWEDGTVSASIEPELAPLVPAG